MKFVLHYKDEAVYEIEAASQELAIEKADEFWANRTPDIRVEQVEKFSSRLNRLQAYKENASTLQKAADTEKQNKIAILTAQIRLLKPRIDDLIATGTACLENDIPLQGNAYGGHEGYDTHQFITNGWSHLLGFVQNRDPQTRKMLPFTKLGIWGGGACNYNLETDGVTLNVSGDAIYILKRFVDEFDAFENAFYSYVDKVLEKQQKSVDKLISNAEKRVQANQVDSMVTCRSAGKKQEHEEVL